MARGGRLLGADDGAELVGEMGKVGNVAPGGGVVGCRGVVEGVADLLQEAGAFGVGAGVGVLGGKVVDVGVHGVSPGAVARAVRMPRLALP